MSCHFSTRGLHFFHEIECSRTSKTWTTRNRPDTTPRDPRELRELVTLDRSRPRGRTNYDTLDNPPLRVCYPPLTATPQELLVS